MSPFKNKLQPYEEAYNNFNFDDFMQAIDCSKGGKT
jgi:hypothetical protein